MLCPIVVTVILAAVVVVTLSWAGAATVTVTVAVVLVNLKVAAGAWFVVSMMGMGVGLDLVIMMGRKVDCLQIGQCQGPYQLSNEMHMELEVAQVLQYQQLPFAILLGRNACSTSSFGVVL